MRITMPKQFGRRQHVRPLSLRTDAPRSSVAVGVRLPRIEASSPRDIDDLPRRLDPFEDDFPWIGWSEPKHESIVRSPRRSPTFEADLQRVLRIFAN